MDPLAHNRRLGLRIGDEIADRILVGRKRDKDTDSARLILQLVCYRLSAHLPTSEQDSPVLAFLDCLALDTNSHRDLEAQATAVFLTDEAPAFINLHRDVFGSEFADELTECFRAAFKNRDLAELEVSDSRWLAISFGLASERYRKGTIGLTNEERNFEIADSVEKIRKQLKGGKLKRQVESYLSEEAETLPVCLDREIQLWGYPTASGYDPAIREALINTINTEYRPAVRQQLATEIAKITEHDERSSTTAARIYIECIRECVCLIDMVIADERSAPDRERLRERRETLNQYGAIGRGKGNRGVSVRGIQNVWKQYQKSLPNWTSRINHADKEASRKMLAREHPAVREAVRNIHSSGVGNHSRPVLLKLQKQTPKWAQPIWRELWEEFRQALDRQARKMS